VDQLVLAASATARQVLVLFGPLAFAALLLHAVERLLSHRLQSRFGWRGVLVTGWLGVPIHELSHAAACLLFGHRIERLSLFSPDPATGRLGSVQHAWDRRSVYQQVGRFFIGIAPLLGGAAVLLLLTRLLGPPQPPVTAAGGGNALAEALHSAGDRAGALLTALSGSDAVGRGRTWIYLYLCLCVGAHMSPSAADLKGCWPGLLLLLVLLLLANFTVAVLGRDLAAGDALAAGVVAPLIGPLVLALALGGVCLVLVMLVTALIPVRRAGAA
jgi:hypothetical protein